MYAAGDDWSVDASSGNSRGARDHSGSRRLIMRGGVISFTSTVCMLAAGCASAPQTSELKIRAIPDASAKLRPGAALLADANGQLAIGNVGLALEGFRKALREQPN